MIQKFYEIFFVRVDFSTVNFLWKNVYFGRLFFTKSKLVYLMWAYSTYAFKLFILNRDISHWNFMRQRQSYKIKSRKKFISKYFASNLSILMDHWSILIFFVFPKWKCQGFDSLKVLCNGCVVVYKNLFLRINEFPLNHLFHLFATTPEFHW